MKQIRFISLALFFLVGATLLLACATPPAVTNQVTAVPTIVPATTASTAAATAVPPTKAAATAAPTNTTAASSGASADKVVADAFKKYTSGESFHLEAHTELSPLFFQGDYTPLPGDDPDLVNLFTIKGEQNGADLHYSLTGFLASFIGLFTGFDPNTNEIEIAEVDGTRYMRGTLENETEAKWYELQEQPGSSSSFTPQDMVSPMSDATYPTGSFSKTGTATIGSQTCDVYTANRAAFDAVFSGLIDAALLNTDTLDLESMDRTEYTVTVCPDGNIYRIAYNFDAHAKNDADKKGTFAFETELSDFDENVTITPPAGALPMPASPFASPTELPVPEGTPTTAVTTNFTTMDGEWQGISGEDSPFSFTVEDGAITYLNINYAVSEGGCSTSGVMANSVDDGEIQDSKFSVVLTDSDDVAYTLQGELESNNKAAGTLNIKGTTFCGATDVDFDWTAQHISSPDAVETPEATEEATTGPTTRPSPTRTSTTQPTRVPATQVPATQAPVQPTAAPASTVNGAEIVNAAFAAFAANDLNGALANVSDDVVFNIGGTTGVGKAALQSNLQLALTFGAKFSISNVQQVGDIVTFTTTVTGIRPGTYTSSSAILQDGKITVFNIN